MNNSLSTNTAHTFLNHRIIEIQKVSICSHDIQSVQYYDEDEGFALMFKACNWHLKIGICICTRITVCMCMLVCRCSQQCIIDEFSEICSVGCLGWTNSVFLKVSRPRISKSFFYFSSSRRLPLLTFLTDQYCSEEQRLRNTDLICSDSMLITSYSMIRNHHQNSNTSL